MAFIVGFIIYIYIYRTNINLKRLLTTRSDGALKGKLICRIKANYSNSLSPPRPPTSQ